jgi:hypothetical protein
MSSSSAALRARLGGDVRARRPLVLDLLQRSEVADVGDDELDAGDARQQAGDRHRGQLGLAAAPRGHDPAVGPRRRPERMLGVGRQRLVLAMREAHATGRGDPPERLVEQRGVEPRHAVRGAGERLEVGDAGAPQRRDLVHVLGPQVRGEREVHARAVVQVLALCLQLRHRAHRPAVRVLDHRGDARASGRRRPGREVLALRLHRVH